MSKTMITSYAAFLAIAFAVVGVTAVQASEVLGTLSSSAATTTPLSGNIGGTVSSDSGGGSGGSSSRGGGGSSSNAPAGSVLGAADAAAAPGFPNAGFAYEGSNSDMTFWLRVVAFLQSIFSI